LDILSNTISFTFIKIMSFRSYQRHKN